MQEIRNTERVRGMEDFWKLQEDMLDGKAGGKIIWQPRIACWYDDRIFRDGTLPGRYSGMDLPALYRDLHVSNRVYDYSACFRLIEDETIKRMTVRLNEYETEERIDTPVGSLTCIMRTNSSNGGCFQKKWFVTCEEELKTMSYVVQHQNWEWNEEAWQAMQRKWGKIGMPNIFFPRVSIQCLFVELMGVEETIYALADYPETVEEFFDVYEKRNERLIPIINGSPIRIVNFGDNVHGGLLTDELFEKYILPVYQRRCRLLHEHNKFVNAHWDGDTKSILKYAKLTGLDGIEAITPLPQGDVTLKEVKEALGDDIWLMDGIAAILFDERFPEEELMEQVKECIELFAPKLILGISDEMSSTGNIERIRRVAEYVEEYNRRISGNLSEAG